MSDQNHIIKQHTIELHLDEEQGAHLLQNQVSELLLEQVFAELEAIFDELSDRNEVISIDKLSVDLGFIDEKQVAKELPTKMKEVIRKELTDQIQKARVQESYGNIEITRSPNADEPIVNIYGNQQNLILALEHYLKTGTLRWADSHEKAPTLKELLSNLAFSQPQVLREILLTQFRNPNVRKRLVYNCPEELLKILLELFSDNFKKWLFLIIKDITKTSKLLSQFTISDRKIKDKILLNALLYLALNENKSSSTFTPKFSEDWAKSPTTTAAINADRLAAQQGRKKLTLKNLVKSPSFLAKDKEKFIQFLIPQLRTAAKPLTTKKVSEQAWVGRFYEALLLQTNTGSTSPRTKHTIASLRKLIKNSSNFSNAFKTIVLNEKWMRKLAGKYKNKVPHVELTELLELPEFGNVLTKDKTLRKALQSLKSEQTSPSSQSADDKWSEPESKPTKRNSSDGKSSHKKSRTSKQEKAEKQASSEAVESKKIKELKRMREIADLREAEGESEELQSEFYIDNSGMAIIWGYLRPFFTHLKLFEDGAFVSNEARQRAALLLHYLVHEETSCEEHQLVLNKLFCGIPLSDVVATNIEITEEEEQECEKLLKAILRNWDILKSSSTNAFRKTFLQREGVLIKQDDDDWSLKVNRTGVDVVLEYLPWSISMIKMPWNDFMIFVTW